MKESAWYYCFCGLYSGCLNNHYYNGCITIASYVKWTIFTITLKKLCQKLEKIKLELFELIEGIMEYVRVDW